MLKLIALLCAVAGFTWFLTTPLRSGLWRFPGPLWRRYTGIHCRVYMLSLVPLSNIALDLFHALDTDLLFFLPELTALL